MFRIKINLLFAVSLFYVQASLPGILYADIIELRWKKGLFTHLYNSADERSFGSAKENSLSKMDKKQQKPSGSYLLTYTVSLENPFRFYLGTDWISPSLYIEGHGKSEQKIGIIMNHPEFLGDSSLQYRYKDDGKDTIYSGIQYAFYEQRLWIGGGLRQTKSHAYNRAFSGAFNTIGNPEPGSPLTFFYWASLSTIDESEAFEHKYENTIRTGGEIKLSYSIPIDASFSVEGDGIVFLGIGKMRRFFIDMMPQYYFQIGNGSARVIEKGIEIDNRINFEIKNGFFLLIGFNVGMVVLKGDSLYGFHFIDIRKEKESIIVSRLPLEYSYRKQGYERYGSIYTGISYKFEP